jgi:hypothetical protein
MNQKRLTGWLIDVNFDDVINIFADRQDRKLEFLLK